MQTSGLVLDVYDDCDGTVLRGLYPQQGDLPEMVKSAHALSVEERGQLPDDAYALVLVGEQGTLRKFACVDEGNTVLSVGYFLKNAHKLSGPAQKTAAQNLVTACGWYDIEPPAELLKAAGIVGALGSAVVNKAVSDPIGTIGTLGALQGAKHQAEENMAAVHALEGGNPFSGRIVSPGDVQEALGRPKHGEATGTAIMPLNGPGDLSPATSKAVLKKTAMQPYAEAADPVRRVIEKRASRCALPGKYPLDSLVDVKLASAYFQEFGTRFAPADRHEYCVNLVKRASELGLDMPQEVRRYGSEEYASDEEIKVAFDLRRGILTDDNATALLGVLFEKRAELSPDALAAVLEEFDKVAGINFYYGQEIPDPYESVFGLQKSAEDMGEGDGYVFNEGNTFVRGSELKNLKVHAYKVLEETFGKDFADEFKKDPIGIFKSMPIDQKKIIANMARDDQQ